MSLNQQPIVKAFRIIGLHGYKDIEISFRDRARVVIAENGSGKTTILTALHAFLSANFEKLRAFSFESIECEFAGRLTPAVLRRSYLPQTVDTASSTLFKEFSQYYDGDQVDIRTTIASLDFTKPIDVSVTPVLRDIYYGSPFSSEQVLEYAQSLQATLQESSSDELKGLSSEIKSAIGQIEVLYLPTYRRVELPLEERESDLPRWSTSGHYTVRQPRITKRARYGELGIQFGLADVENRLNEILADIQRESNLGYRRISADIIDDLLAGKLSVDVDNAQMPDIEALQLFFSRLESAGKAAQRRLEMIQGLYSSKQIQSTSNEALRYFLSKLSRVVDRTRELETTIERFVAKANEYLEQSSDEKKLKYDANRMKVLVENSWSREIVKLNDLSSGEKQVISLLAHLHLYPRRKIVLIDEPELSLSIEWQKRLLPDLLDSPTCAQLLAITHSPFIFDNELDPFAGPLKISRHTKRPS